MDLRTQERIQEVALLLRNAPEFQLFIAWLKDRREKARDRLEAKANDTDSGRAAELREILQFIEDSPVVLERLRDRSRSSTTSSNP
jgi:hypothetical protein